MKKIKEKPRLVNKVLWNVLGMLWLVKCCEGTCEGTHRCMRCDIYKECPSTREIEYVKSVLVVLRLDGDGL